MSSPRRPRRHGRGSILVPFLIAAASGAPAWSDDGGGSGVYTEYGDAPEGIDAYPWLGVAGEFPTCEVGGPAGFIRHAHPGMPMASPLFLGPDVDPEPDGNGGFCPPPPYNMDECGPSTGDAGLEIPGSWSIDPGWNPISCDAFPPKPLGSTCELLDTQSGKWFEGRVTNLDTERAYLNVLVDWNQDGTWNAYDFCGSEQVDEHVFQNVPIPPGYIGPLSGLNLPPLRVGPNAGFVWMRMTVTPQFPRIDIPWDGSGDFDSGETEDYLIEITEAEEGELGDAPEDALAYPDGTMGAFPTCRFSGPGGYVLHTGPTVAYLGATHDTELEGNAGQCPPAPYDEDECFGDPDAGLRAPEAVTLDAVGQVVSCPGGSSSSGWPACRQVTWGPDVDLEITNNGASERYLNVLADWDGNGRWDDAPVTTCGGTAPEHVVVNHPVPAGYSGLASGLAIPDFTAGEPDVELAWCRFTITEEPIPVGWTGNGVFGDGETEDYLIPIPREPLGVEPGAENATPGAVRIASVRPNPARHGTEIELVVTGSAAVEVTILDAAGRRVRRIEGPVVDAGVHAVSWDGRTDDGRDAAPGAYFVRVRSGETDQTRRLVLVR